MVNFCLANLILKIEENKQHFWHIMLYYFKIGKNAIEIQKRICAVYGESAVTDQMCEKWFAKYRAGDVLLDDAPWLGRPVEVDGNQIETLLENNQHWTAWERANMLRISKSIKLLVKIKNMLLFYGKKYMICFGQPSMKSFYFFN